MAAPAAKEAQGWHQLVAGASAGTAAVLVLHPFDVVKTRLQVQDGGLGILPVYKGPIDAVSKIMRQEGWRAFYAGLAPAVLGSAVAWGTYFYFYEGIKRQYTTWQKKERLSPGWNLLSAAQAGGLVCLLTNPIWLIKTRMQLQSKAAAAAGAAAPYRSLRDAVVQIGRTEGWRGYYKGLGPSLLLQTTHGAVQFAVYEELKHFAGRWRQPPAAADRQLGSLELSLYGGLSKFAAAVLTYPSQVVRSRLQQRFEGRSLVYTSAWQVVSLTAQREGLRGFYKGLVPSLLRVIPQSAVTLVFYENMMRVMGGGQGQGQGGAAAAAAAAGDGDGLDDVERGLLASSRPLEETS